MCVLILAAVKMEFLSSVGFVFFDVLSCEFLIDPLWYS